MKKLLLGLVLATVSVAPTAARANCHGASSAPKASDSASKEGSSAKLLEIILSDDVSVPRELSVKAGEPVHLSITRKTNHTCATKLVVREYGIDALLPLGKTVVVDFKPKVSGRIRLLCSMGETISTLVVQ